MEILDENIEEGSEINHSFTIKPKFPIGTQFWVFTGVTTTTWVVHEYVVQVKTQGPNSFLIESVSYLIGLQEIKKFIFGTVQLKIII